jgi:hypothetical protein
MASDQAFLTSLDSPAPAPDHPSGCAVARSVVAPPDQDHGASDLFLPGPPPAHVHHERLTRPLFPPWMAPTRAPSARRALLQVYRI